MALHRKDLDELNCQDPDCDHTAHDGLVLNSECHPGEPTWVGYRAMTGNVRVVCSVCGQTLTEIAVAP